MALDGIDIVLATSIYFLGALVQCSFGLGGALVSAPLLILINPVFIPAPILMANILLTMIISKREWSAINFRDLGFMVTGRFLGTIPALFLIATVYFDFLFASMILLAVLLNSVGHRFTINPYSLTVSGMASGFMGTLSSIGGPPVALVYQGAPKIQFVATMSMQLVLGGMISVIGIIFVSGITFSQILATASLLPGLFLGLFCSSKINHQITSHRIRIGILLLSSMSAVIVLWRALSNI